jgi:hypothetical protein
MQKLALFILPLLLTACGGEIQLTQPMISCEYEGETYAVGAGGIPAIDGCNTCYCDETGAVVCTEKFCVDPNELTDMPNPAGFKCIDDGYEYEYRGDDFPDGEGFCLDAASGTECPDQAYLDGECQLGMTLRQDFRTELIGSIASGEASASYETGNFVIDFLASTDLPELTDGEVYAAWLVRIEPFDAFPVGELREVLPGPLLVTGTTSERDLRDYKRAVITRGPADADFTDLAVVLEGTLAPFEIAN